MMASFQYVPEHLEKAAYDYAEHGKTKYKSEVLRMNRKVG
jgi:hypothetical protein